MSNERPKSSFRVELIDVVLANNVRGLALLHVALADYPIHSDRLAYFAKRCSLKAFSLAEAGDMMSSEGETYVPFCLPLLQVLRLS